MVTKSQKEKNAYVERKVAECFQWKANGQCSRGDSCSFSHEPAFGNQHEAQRRKGQQSSPAPNSKAKTDGEKSRQQRSKLFRQKEQNPVLLHILKTHHVIFDIHPNVKITSLRQDADVVTDVIFDMLSHRRSPTRSRRKVVLKDQLLYRRRPYSWVVCLKILIRESLFYGKKENWDQISPLNSPRARGTI